MTRRMEMTDAKLKVLVSEAVVLDRKIRELMNELKEVKDRLIAEAESRPEEHTETDGGGSAWAIAGQAGDLARVSFPAPTLKSSIPGEGKTIEKIRQVCGNSFIKLFLQVPAYKPMPEFRKAAAEEGLGRKLLSLVETETKPRVSFETKVD
jgi:hypothetical protein